MNKEDSPLYGIRTGFHSSVDKVVVLSSSPLKNSSDPPRDDVVLRFVFLSPRNAAMDLSSVSLGLRVPGDGLSLVPNLSC